MKHFKQIFGIILLIGLISSFVYKLYHFGSAQKDGGLIVAFFIVLLLMISLVVYKIIYRL